MSEQEIRKQGLYDDEGYPYQDYELEEEIEEYYAEGVN